MYFIYKHDNQTHLQEIRQGRSRNRVVEAEIVLSIVLDSVWRACNPLETGATHLGGATHLNATAIVKLNGCDPLGGCDPLKLACDPLKSALKKFVFAPSFDSNQLQLLPNRF